MQHRSKRARRRGAHCIVYTLTAHAHKSQRVSRRPQGESVRWDGAAAIPIAVNGAGAHLEYREEKPRAFGACEVERGLLELQIISGRKFKFVAKLDYLSI